VADLGEVEVVVDEEGVAEMAEKAEKVEKVEKAEKVEKVEKAEKAEKAEKVEKAENVVTIAMDSEIIVAVVEMTASTSMTKEPSLVLELRELKCIASTNHPSRDTYLLRSHEQLLPSRDTLVLFFIYSYSLYRI
jgi:hypothetical protein